MTDLIQIIRPIFEAEYESRGYPYQAQFLDEYVTQMKAMDENICCYDFQAAALQA